LGNNGGLFPSAKGTTMSTVLEKYELYNLAQSISEEDTFTLERYEQFHRYMPEGATTVLDVGAGLGRGGARLAELNPKYKISAIDVVKSRLDRLPECYEQGLLGSATKLPIDDQSFDMIVAGEFIEHLYPADVDPAICEFQRVLKVGGRLMMTTPNPGSLTLRLKKGTIYTVGHLTQHWPEEMKHRLRMHGFSRVRIIGSGKSTRYIGYHFPILSAYGSYLVIGDKI
jgi:ubiquinone/menaquinone biosynthesis C-methylase UbiE